MPEDIREKVMAFVKKSGPVLPIQISKYLETDLILSAAILSELVSRKQLRVSSANIGSSPLYYIQGQEHLLGPKLYNHLKSKEREAYDFLRDNKLIRDGNAEPWQRVAFRQLKDFAIPLYVTTQDKTEIFWRFYLMSELEAKNNITEILQQKKQEKIKKPIQEQITLKDIEKPKIEELKSIEEPEILEESKSLEEPKIEPQKIEILVKQEKPKIKKIKKITPKPKIELEFYNSIITYLNKNKINRLEEKIIRKNREYEFIVEFPSALGNLKYFIKAKNKKTINEAEVVLAYSQSQERKTSCLLLTNGNLTKKAKELIEKKLQGQFVFKQI